MGTPEQGQAGGGGREEAEVRGGHAGARGEAFGGEDERPFAVMQATMTAVFGRPGISG